MGIVGILQSILFVYPFIPDMSTTRTAAQYETKLYFVALLF